MEIFRTSVTLLSICLFHSSLSETQNVCKGTLPEIKHVAVNSNVTVPCPLLSATEMEFKLFKGSDQVTSIYIKINDTSNDINKNSPDFPAILHVKFMDNSTSFILLGVTTNFTDLYTCEAEINYPPPFKKVPFTPQTIVLVEEKQEQTRIDLCQNGSHQALWVLFGIMAIYGLVTTCIVIILQIKFSQTGTSFKDRECRRKWQGVQHPTRLGFHKDTVV
ncbi:T-cell-specific surface glycoprotein CD28 [Pseudorasbora parva]|uniref:T-cell-specific surface glycoprotein CD28 n=1 Tax=Pseudorasbora parva TaxID=51549 RepID=UPI00351EDF33